MPKKITIDAPSSTVILAARHLDHTEGPVQVGTIVDSATRSAITLVLRYIARAHNAPAAPEICELPHESIEEEDVCERQRLARDSALLKQTLTQAILDLKLPLPAHNHGDFDDGLEAAIETVAQVFDTLE